MIFYALPVPRKYNAHGADTEPSNLSGHIAMISGKKISKGLNCKRD